ncbi:MAG: hypothetical protein Q4E34_02895 [Synergistaceae bacterium]|nr:hypothetical protein [Synergistaceae bacterium]
MCKMSTLSELCDYIKCCNPYNDQVDKHLVIIALATRASQITTQHVKTRNNFFKPGLLGLFKKRNYLEEAQDINSLKEEASGLRDIIDEILSLTSVKAKELFTEDDTYTTSIKMFREFFDAQQSALEQFFILASGLARKARGESYSIQEYNTTLQKLEFLEDVCDRKTGRLERILKER